MENISNLPTEYNGTKLVKFWQYNDKLVTDRYEDSSGQKKVLPWVKNLGKWSNKAPKDP